MNLVTISINNKDLPYTIDTYGMYNGESVEEGEQMYYAEDYEMSMFEKESEAYFENMTLTEDSQKLIDSKEAKDA